MPVAMITGTSGKTTTSRLVAAILREQGHCVGLTCTDGIYVDGVLTAKGDLAGYKGARRLFRNRRITAAVLETARGGLLKQGLFMRRGKVGALLNIGNDHVGMDGIDDLDAMARHKAQVVIGSRRAVLNGDDTCSARFIDQCGPHRVILFSARYDAPDLARVLDAGGAAVFADDAGQMMLAEGKSPPQRIAAIADIPITLGGRAPHYAADAMAAAAIAHGLGVPVSVIASGLVGFREGNPGRWTEFDGFPFTLLSERAYHAAAFKWIARVTETMPVAGRRILLLTAIGNRINDQYDELAALAAAAFDRFIVYDLPDYRRGRTPGEVPALLERALLDHGVPQDRISLCASPEAALDMASTQVRPGDMVLVLTPHSHQYESYIRRAFASHKSSGGL